VKKNFDELLSDKKIQMKSQKKAAQDFSDNWHVNPFSGAAIQPGKGTFRTLVKRFGFDPRPTVKSPPATKSRKRYDISSPIRRPRDVPLDNSIPLSYPSLCDNDLLSTLSEELSSSDRTPRDFDSDGTDPYDSEDEFRENVASPRLSSLPAGERLRVEQHLEQLDPPIRQALVELYEARIIPSPQDIFNFQLYPDTKVLANNFQGIECHFRTAVWIIIRYVFLKDPEDRSNIMAQAISEPAHIKTMFRHLTDNRVEPKVLLAYWYAHYKPEIAEPDEIDRLYRIHYRKIESQFNKLYRLHVDPTSTESDLHFICNSN